MFVWDVSIWMNGKCAVPIDRLQLYGRKRFISEMYLNCVLKIRVISQFRSKRIRRKASWAKDKEIFFSFFLSFQHIWKPVILIVMKSKFFHLNLNLFRTNLFYFHFSEVSRRHSEFMFRLLFCMECVCVVSSYPIQLPKSSIHSLVWRDRVCRHNIPLGSSLDFYSTIKFTTEILFVIHNVM